MPPQEMPPDTAAPAEPGIAKHESPSFGTQLITFLTFVFLIVPVLVIIIAFFFGLILAEVEGWPIVDGFYYVTSMLCGLPAPLTDVEPDSMGGKIMDIIIAIWSLAVAGTVIGVVAGMSLITRLIEKAEAAFAKVAKNDDAEEEVSELDETAALKKRLTALEHVVHKKEATIAKILAATGGSK